MEVYHDLGIDESVGLQTRLKVRGINLELLGESQENTPMGMHTQSRVTTQKQWLAKDGSIFKEGLVEQLGVNYDDSQEVKDAKKLAFKVLEDKVKVLLPVLIKSLV